MGAIGNVHPVNVIYRADGACLGEARSMRAVGERNLRASPHGEAAYGSPAVQPEGRNPGSGINVIRTPPNGGVA